MMTNKQKKPFNISKFILVIALIILSIWIFIYFTPEKLRQIILSSGAFAELIYVILWILLPIGFFPVPILATVGGLGFGFVKGSLLTFIGAACNLSLVFLLSRYLFRDWIQSFLYRKFPSSKKILETSPKNLRTALILARLMPIIPYTAENYAFGLTNISFFDYLIWSLIFILPGVVIYVNFGDKSVNAGSPEFIVSIILLIILVFGTAFLGKYLNFDNEEETQ